VLLITNMQSNIIEDLNTLRLIAKLVPDYCGGHDEAAIKAHAFDLVFAVDEVVSPGGHREAVSAKDIGKFTSMESADEKLSQIIEDSKIHTQKQFLADKAKSFDDIRARAIAAAGGRHGMSGGGLTGMSGTRFPGSDLMSTITTGIRTLKERSGAGGPQRAPYLGTGMKMEGFGSDSMPSSLSGGGGGGG
jgi:hypothetical protein